MVEQFVLQHEVGVATFLALVFTQAGSIMHDSAERLKYHIKIRYIFPPKIQKSLTGGVLLSCVI